MILISKDRGYEELKTLIRTRGVQCQPEPLAYGDIAFDGNGPDGVLSVGIERKRLHDMLSCIEDARLVSHQRLGMKKMYGVSFLLLEGMWKPHENGLLMESRDGINWFICKPNGRPVEYSRLRRYLMSITLSGMSVNFTRNIQHTVIDVVELFHYFQKPWNKHSSLLEIQKLAIPQLNGKPSLVRKWANDIEGIGVKFGEEAERVFRKPIRLAMADEEQWLLAGVSVHKAQDIVRQIQGFK